MAAQHVSGGKHGRSDGRIVLLFLLISLLSLTVIIVLGIILLSGLDDGAPAVLPPQKSMPVQPAQPTRPIIIEAVVAAATHTLIPPTQAPTLTAPPTITPSPTPTFTATAPYSPPTPTSQQLTATPPPATETPPATATPYSETTATALPLEEGWHGEYYNNLFLTGNPTQERYEASLDFNWGYKSPSPLVPVDQFSARWTRELYLEAGTYQFYAHGDDGVRVWVDNLLLINEWHEAPGQTYQAPVTLRSGKHSIKVEYYEDEGTAEIQFWWEGPGSYADWRGEYWANQLLSGDSTLVRNDEVIDFNWGRDAPDEKLPKDLFSARWTRLLAFEEGTYHFYATVDDGMRLYIDNELVIYEWHDGNTRQAEATYWLAGGMHSLRVEYYENKGGALIHFWWEKESSD